MPCLLIVSKAHDDAAHACLEEFLIWRLSDLRSLGSGVFVSAVSSDFPYIERTESEGGTIDGLPEGTNVYLISAEGGAELLFESPPSAG